MIFFYSYSESNDPIFYRKYITVKINCYIPILQYMINDYVTRNI